MCPSEELIQKKQMKTSQQPERQGIPLRWQQPWFEYCRLEKDSNTSLAIQANALTVPKVTGAGTVYPSMSFSECAQGWCVQGQTQGWCVQEQTQAAAAVRQVSSVCPLETEPRYLLYHLSELQQCLGRMQDRVCSDLMLLNKQIFVFRGLGNGIVRKDFFKKCGQGWGALGGKTF